MSIRVYELAKSLGVTSKELIAELSSLNIPVKGHMSVLDEDTAEIIRHELQEKQNRLAAVKEEKAKAERTVIHVQFPLSVKELAVKIQKSTTEVIKQLMKMKVMANINQNLNDEVSKSLAREYGYELEQEPTVEEQLLAAHRTEDSKNLLTRQPVVTLMGHVDHGKTSLLDAIRKSDLIAREAGGITQHIGAYEITVGNGKITFLDTPGHEAFTAMRARGANITDIVVLVVAADDGIMPQTVEAINHAKAAGVPIVVAINKIDLPGADLDKVKRQLSEIGLTSEDWGGSTITVPVSATRLTGVDHLLEMLLLETEMLELKADKTGPARGIVIESRMSRGSGPIASVLVTSGTLRLGDVLVCGDTYGKVRAMINDLGERVKEAGPAVPVEINGISQVPQIGDNFYVVDDEKKARELSQHKTDLRRDERMAPLQRVSLDQLFEKASQGEVKELKVILKADVQGSLEALGSSLEKLSTKDIKVRIIHFQVGAINESDVMLAAASDAVIIGFHVGIDSKARDTAEQQGIDIRLYRIIYEAINDVRLSLEGLLEPTLKEIFQGRAKVLQMFKVSNVGRIAGCQVVKGKMLRTGQVKVFRGDTVVHEGKIESLKRYKDDVREVSEGMECGISLERFSDLQPDDLIECYLIEKIARKL